MSISTPSKGLRVSRPERLPYAIHGSAPPPSATAKAGFLPALLPTVADRSLRGLTSARYAVALAPGSISPWWWCFSLRPVEGPHGSTVGEVWRSPGQAVGRGSIAFHGLSGAYPHGGRSPSSTGESGQEHSRSKAKAGRRGKEEARATAVSRHSPCTSSAGIHASRGHSTRRRQD